MHLFDLPVELLMTILEQTVLTVGLTEAVVLRLVCKMFNDEIPTAMANVKILDIDHPRLHDIPRNSWIVIEHIFRETRDNKHSTAILPAAIRLAVQALVVDNAEDTEARQEDCIRTLSEAAAWRMSTLEVLHYLKSGSEERLCYFPGGKRSCTNHIVAAAAYLGDLGFFRQLITEGDIDSSENMIFGNPLRCAVAQGHYELTKFMLDHGVDVNQADQDIRLGPTALQAAAESGQVDFIHLILNPKYKCNTSEDGYLIACFDAATAGHFAIVHLLLEHVDIQRRQELLDTFLTVGVLDGEEDWVQFALESGADPNSKVEAFGGHLPLKAAIRKGYDKIKKMLLENGAIPISVVDESDESDESEGMWIQIPCHFSS